MFNVVRSCADSRCTEVNLCNKTIAQQTDPGDFIDHYLVHIQLLLKLRTQEMHNLAM